MQNKSAIWIFSVLLAIACLYQLSFTFVANGVEGDAEAYANAKVDSLRSADSEVTADDLINAYDEYETEFLTRKKNEAVYPLFGFSYDYVRRNQINLGLDLQGGMNVTLEVSVEDLIRALAGFSDDPLFNQAIVKAKEMQKEAQDDFVTLFGQAFSELDPNAKLAAIFHTRENQEKFPRDASNEDILNIIRAEAEDAIDRTEQVLRKRIDNLGVVQPSIQRLATSDRIVVELPGVKEKARVRKILQGTAKLEFWETYSNAEVANFVSEIDVMLADKLKDEEPASDSTSLEDKIDNVDAPAVSDLFEDDKQVDGDSAKNEELASGDTNNLDDIFGGSDSTGTGVADDTLASGNNPLFEILIPNYVQNAQGGYSVGQGPVIGFANTADTSKVMEMLTSKDAKRILPKRIRFYWDAKPFEGNNGTELVSLYAVQVKRKDRKAPMEGDAVTNARVDADPMGRPMVSLSMNAKGANDWRNLTRENVGKSIAIVLDGYIYSAPNVNGEIAGGRSSIEGQFTNEEAEDLANVLKAGKLPAPSKIIEEAIVGPSLGEEAIQDGLMSFLIALIIVLAYMAFYYSGAGIAADIALLANLFFVLGVLTSLGATLTLPGIAGIVLTIGMSVDANVLIYERIREELRAGKGLRLAIVDGYNNAYSSILDANITTLLTGIILAIFGTGPILGFATTLIIGILTSLFSAIFITRLVFEFRLEKGKDISFDTSMTRDAFRNMQVKFIQKRKMWYAVSGTVVLAGIISLLTIGLDYGVDFTGGRSYLVRFENNVSVGDIGDNLATVFVTEDGRELRPEVKTYGANNQAKIVTKFMIDDDGLEVEDIVEGKLREGLDESGMTYEIMSSQKVEPTIADDIKQAAIWSVLFSVIVIFLYIVLRFRRWQFGLGALTATFHDVLIVLSIFSIGYGTGIIPFSLEIDQAFIAAILTVVGYSINDTVVVFDRIREYLGLYKRKEMSGVVNEALNSTLSRTINTSLSTFVVLLMIFLFGGEVIRGFVFALMVGVVVGTYSSLFIASPLVLDVVNKATGDKK